MCFNSGNRLVRDLARPPFPGPDPKRLVKPFENDKRKRPPTPSQGTLLTAAQNAAGTTLLTGR